MYGKRAANSLHYGFRMATNLPLGERGCLTLIWEDGGRSVHPARSVINGIIQTLDLSGNTTLLESLDSGEVVVQFGRERVAERIGLNKVTAKRTLTLAVDRAS